MVAQQTRLPAPDRVGERRSVARRNACPRRAPFRWPGRDESAGPLLLLTAELRRNSTGGTFRRRRRRVLRRLLDLRASRLAERFGGVIPGSVARAAGRLTYASSGANETRLPLTALLSRFLLGIASRRSLCPCRMAPLCPGILIPRLYGPACAISPR